MKNKTALDGSVRKGNSSLSISVVAAPAMS